MTLTASQNLSQLSDAETLGFLESGDVHRRKFGYFEPAVKLKVRNSRNDPPNAVWHCSNMSKLKKRQPEWHVKEWLEFKGLRQKDLVARTDWNKSQINEWVNGKERWNRDVLYGFAHAIGVDWSDLLKPPPTDPVENALARLIVEMDHRQKGQALRVLQAMLQDTAPPSKVA